MGGLISGMFFLCVQDLDVVLSALLKLVGGSRSQANELNAQEFLNQARAFELASRSDRQTVIYHIWMVTWPLIT